MDVCDSLIKWASDAKLFKHDICDEDHKAVAQAGQTNYRRTAQDTAGHYKTTAGQHRTLQDTADVDAVSWLTSYGS